MRVSSWRVHHQPFQPRAREAAKRGRRGAAHCCASMEVPKLAFCIGGFEKHTGHVWDGFLFTERFDERCSLFSNVFMSPCIAPVGGLFRNQL